LLILLAISLQHACSSKGSTEVLIFPQAGYTVAQHSGYGQPYPVIDVVLKNPFDRAICVPSSSFDDRVANIGVKHEGRDLERKEVADIFPTEFSSRLHADAYYFIGVGRGWRAILPIKNFELSPESVYAVSVQWRFYFCDELANVHVARGEDPEHTITLELDNIPIVRPW
jgi:hypothetical protein